MNNVFKTPGVAPIFGMSGDPPTTDLRCISQEFRTWKNRRFHRHIRQNQPQIVYTIDFARSDGLLLSNGSVREIASNECRRSTSLSRRNAARSSRHGEPPSLLSKRRDDLPRAVDPHGRPQDRQIKAGAAVFG